MSGIEVAGLVLGGFPLLISAAEHYRKGFEPLVKWYKFRTQFITFIDAVDIEKQLFDRNIEGFLRSIDIEEDELHNFRDDGGYEGWHRPEVVERLQARLGPSLNVFKSTLRTMNDLIKELEIFLLMKGGQVIWVKEGPDQMDIQMKRLRYSFSKKGTRAVDSLKDQNINLRRLLDAMEKPNGSKARSKKDTAWANVVEAIRRHASSIHTALRASWSCQCGPHTASLRLEQRKTGDRKSSFDLSFGVAQDAHTTVRREVTIKTRNVKDTEIGPNVPGSSLGRVRDTSDDIQAGLVVLRQEFDPEFTSRNKLISRPPLSTSISTPNVPSPYSSFKSIFKSSSSNGTACPTEENITRSSLKINRTKPTKQARFDVPIDVPIDVPVYIVPSPAPVSAEPDKKVQILQIKDFCSVIRSPSVTNQCLGYLCDGEQLHDVLPLSNDTGQEHGEYVSMNVIKEEICGRSPYQRIKLATILASSLLQLQTTPWLMGSFEKENIFFYRRGQELCIEHPYVRQSFVSPMCCTSSNSLNFTQPKPEVRCAPRTSLDNLGILLLELFFGKPIESTSIRERHLVNGEPHQGTDLLTARDWVDDLWEEDPKLKMIVWNCFHQRFEDKPDWRNKSFIKAIYKDIVGPLDDYFVTKWP